MAQPGTDFGARTRGELAEDYRVFYVTAWGYAADHLFGWFPKALNCHRDVFALLAHEGSRPKYLRERTRGERPPIVPFTEFLNDMGMTYTVIGDCYSYRAGQMPELLAIERYKNIPVINLTRHPLAWLEFYVRWRSSNMRMREGASDPLAWEWKVACHAYFDYLGLRPYERTEVEVWAAYQGMLQLNNVLGDIGAVDRHAQLETVADEPETFQSVVRYLSRGRAEFDQADIDRAYSMRYTLFRGEEPVETDPRKLLDSWAGWKVDAFRRLVTREALDAHKSLGYDLLGLDQKVSVPTLDRTKASRPIFVSSVPKSGTWLLRAIIERMTGLTPYEPEIHPDLGTPDYADENLIEFPRGTFFSWHSILTSRSIAMLRGCQAKNVFLIRNIYDVLLAMFNHIRRDADASLGRSVQGGHYFDDKSIEQSLSLMISGFGSPVLTWHGVAPIIEQMASMMELAESGHALLLTYEQLVGDKPEAIARLAWLFEVDLAVGRIEKIIAETDIDAMRDAAKADGRDSHMTKPEDQQARDVFAPYHKEVVDYAVYRTAPQLPERLAKLGIDWILRP
jgi:Sulfotransferase domain